MTYKVELDIYNGPMDLLLYLIRREEVEITDLPVARIADQYIEYLDVLKALDIELAGEFVVMAATLLELKSRALLPRPPELEDEDEAEDPRETLIRQLIDQGAIVALATDFNPGSSMTESMFFILQLAVFTLKMGIEEAINAATANAAYAISRHTSLGSLELGKKMDLLLCDVPNYAYLGYHIGTNPITHVIKNGKIVVKDGQRIIG